MGTHPIFESDFDCLTVLNGIWVEGGSSDGGVIDVGGHSGGVKMTLMTSETIGGTDHCQIDLNISSPEIEAQIRPEFDNLYDELSKQKYGQTNISSLHLSPEKICEDKREVAKYIVDCLINNLCETGSGEGEDPFSEQRIGFQERIIILVCAFIFVFGLLGNGLTLWILVQSKKWKKNTTNMFIVSLTTADLLVVLILVPITGYIMTDNKWHFSNLACKVFHFLGYLNLSSSNYLMLLMSSERFCAILFTMDFVKFKTRKSASHAIIGAWITAIVTALPALWLYSVSDPSLQGISICMFGNIGQAHYVKAFKVTLFVLTYLIPAFTVTSQAVLISRFLHKTPLGQTEKSQRRRIKVLLMTVTCCFLFLVCWTPHHTYQLMTAFDSDFSTTGGFIFMLLARFLALTNSIINPIIYFTISENFQQELRRVCCIFIPGDRKLRREDTKNGTIQSSSDFQSSWNRQSRRSYRFGEQSIKNPNFVSTKLLNNE